MSVAEQSLLEDYGYFRQRKLPVLVLDLNSMAGKTLDYAHIYVLGDSHEGDIYAREDAVDYIIGWVQKDPNGFVVLIGDLIDAPNRHSVGNVHHQVKDPQTAKLQLVERLKPIKDKILLSVGGNHDSARAAKEAGGDFAQDIAAMLGVYYSDGYAALRLKVGKYNSGGAISYDTVVSHGAGGGRTKGGKANSLARMGDILIADLYICGHTHQEMVFPDPIFVCDENREWTKDGRRFVSADLMPRKFLMGGSLRDWGGYAERGLMSPNMVSMPRARLDGSKKWIKIES